MGRLSERAGKNRLAIIGGIGAVFATAWLVLDRTDPELMSETRVEARIAEVLHAPANTTPGPRKGVALVVVELTDGGRATVFAPLSLVDSGADLPVTVRYYDDGSRQITAAGEE